MRIFHLWLLLASILLAPGSSRLDGRVLAAEEKPLIPQGAVVDPDGKPISGATVTLHRWDGTWSAALEETTTDAEGRFAFPARREDAYYYTILRKPSCGAWIQLATSAATSKITLKPAVETWVDVRGDDGQPLAGGRVANLSIRLEENGTAYVFRGMEQTLGWTFGPSGETGRLDLPPLPDGALLDLQVEHPNRAQAKLANLRVAKGTLGAITLPAGVMTTLEFVADPRTPRNLDGLTVEAQMVADGAPEARISRRPLTIREGRAEICLHAATYRRVELKSPKLLITPVHARDSQGLVIDPSGPNRHRFLVRKTIPVSGRVIAPDGSSHKGARVYGRVENLSPDGTTPKGEEWTHTGFTETDAEGRFTAPFPPGRCLLRVMVEGHVTDRDDVELDVSADGTLALADVVARKLEPLRGRVLGVDGEPVPGAIVRPRHPTMTWMPPVLSDSAGKFELALSAIPYDMETEERRLELDLAAYVADQPLSGRLQVDLRQPASLRNLEIVLQPEISPETLFQFEDVEWRKRRLAERASERRQSWPAGLAGQSPPELDAAAWLNTDARSLREFRGRYVLLDFWFTGCGPCHADFPSVKLVHERFEKHGVTVIGVHDNSSAVEAVREHCRENGLTFPIVVDHADGRILAAYRKLGVEGFPSYLLIGPDGTIVQNDATDAVSLLRSFKLEVIRQRILTRAAAAP